MAEAGDIRAGKAFVELYADDKTGPGLDRMAGRIVHTLVPIHAIGAAARTLGGIIAVASGEGVERLSKAFRELPFGIGSSYSALESLIDVLDGTAARTAAATRAAEELKKALELTGPAEEWRKGAAALEQSRLDEVDRLNAKITEDRNKRAEEIAAATKNLYADERARAQTAAEMFEVTQKYAADMKAMVDADDRLTAAETKQLELLDKRVALLREEEALKERERGEAERQKMEAELYKGRAAEEEALTKMLEAADRELAEAERKVAEEMRRDQEEKDKAWAKNVLEPERGGTGPRGIFNVAALLSLKAGPTGDPTKEIAATNRRIADNTNRLVALAENANVFT